MFNIIFMHLPQVTTEPMALASPPSQSLVQRGLMMGSGDWMGLDGPQALPNSTLPQFSGKVSLLKSGMSPVFRMVKFTEFTEFIATTVLIKDDEHHVFFTCFFRSQISPAMIPHAKVHGGTAAPAPRAPVPTRPLNWSQQGAFRTEINRRSTGIRWNTHW